MELYSKSDIGLVRKSNQDSFYTCFLEDDVALAVVCDGMGGANAGNIASKLAVDEIKNKIMSCYKSGIQEDEIEELLYSAVDSANSVIYEASQGDEALCGMGTTAVVSMIFSDVFYTVHAGDSRAYLIKESGVEQITTDHSIVQEMVNNGEITQEQAQNHPRKNIITRALGVSREIRLDYIKKSLSENDAILICTDGLTNHLDAGKIYQIYKENEPSELSDVLISAAKELGGSDNITVVIVKR